MQQVSGDLWLVPADAYVITTNGAIRKDGAAVMGRGIALQAKQRFHGLIKQYGNHVFVLPRKAIGFDLLSFPVKHHWSQKADLELIKRSVGELINTVDIQKYKRVVMPRPGCGNGRLDWKEVAPLLAALDDRFIVVWDGK